MARTRSEHYPEIQRTILQHSARCFAQTGYARSSISDLAEACSLSKGALYHYFQSKEAILFGILDAHVRELIEHMEKAAQSTSEVDDQCRAVIRAMVEFNATSQSEQIVLLNDLTYLSKDEQSVIKGLERRLVDIVSDVLVRLDSSGKITRRNKKVYAMMLFGILNYTYTWYNPNGSVSPREYADMATDLLMNGMHPAMPAKSKA